MASGSVSALHTGETIIISGLVVQILFFTAFVITAGTFHKRMLKTKHTRVPYESIPWQKHMITLYLASVLIWVRCVFRLIEYAQGNDGYLISHEVYLYIFDALLMWLTMVVLAVIHPSEIEVLLRQSGKKPWTETAMQNL